MERILNKDTNSHINGQIMVSGWVDSRRDHGGIVFLDLRDRSGLLQVVCQADLVKEIKEECVVEIAGLIKERPARMVNADLVTGKVEMQAESIKVLAGAQQLPFDIKNLNVSLPVLLDWRPLAFKNKKIQEIFQVQEIVTDSFRQSLKNLGFLEFQAPIIVPANAEGGAAVFHVDYYKDDAYLAQSPQLYKQIMVGGFERVFTVTKVFRAEPSVTTRHLAEYTSLDAEMGFISSWEELMATCQAVMKTVLANLENKYQIDLPKISGDIPRIKMREAQEIIFQRTKRDNRKEPDLAPDDEKDICEYAREKYGSDFIFITHYPTKKRPFYTFADPQDPDYTLSFDLLCRGLEIVTGGQRINEYDKLVANIKKWGNKPADFEYYLQAFKYGLPPEGGFAIGLERLTKQIMGLENIREACAFPRDMERIDQRLSASAPEKKAKKKTKKGKRKKRSG